MSTVSQSVFSNFMPKVVTRDPGGSAFPIPYSYSHTVPTPAVGHSSLPANCSFHQVV